MLALCDTLTWDLMALLTDACVHNRKKILQRLTEFQIYNKMSVLEITNDVWKQSNIYVYKKLIRTQNLNICYLLCKQDGISKIIMKIEIGLYFFSKNGFKWNTGIDKLLDNIYAYIWM